jgi:hypothetical protein
METIQDKTYSALLTEIRKRIPQNSRLVNTLVDILLIEKEAVYRRLRGEVPFTFQEIAIIARQMGLSLDAIIGLEEQQGKPFRLKLPDFITPCKEDFMMIDTCIRFFKSFANEEDTEIAEMSTLLPQDLFPRFEYLSKLSIFKWHYYYYNNNQVKPFHEFAVPDIIQEAFKEQYLQTKDIKKTHYIFDNQLCRHVVTDVIYFNNIRLINEEDRQKIKENLFRFLDYLEKLTISGTFEETGNSVCIYISDVDLTATYSYMKARGITFSMVKTFILTSVTSTDEDMFEKMKSWIQSTIRTSTLITLANEKQRVLFFEKQRKIVNQL